MVSAPWRDRSQAGEIVVSLSIAVDIYNPYTSLATNHTHPYTLNFHVCRTRTEHVALSDSRRVYYVIGEALGSFVFAVEGKVAHLPSSVPRYRDQRPRTKGNIQELKLLSIQLQVLRIPNIYDARLEDGYSVSNE